MVVLRPLRKGDLVKPTSTGWQPTVGVVADVDACGNLSIMWPDGWITFMHDTREFILMEEDD